MLTSLPFSASHPIPTTSRQQAENDGLIALAHLDDNGGLAHLFEVDANPDVTDDDVAEHRASAGDAKAAIASAKQLQTECKLAKTYNTLECAMVPFYMKYVFDIHDRSIDVVPQHQDVISIMAMLAFQHAFGDAAAADKNPNDETISKAVSKISQRSQEFSKPRITESDWFEHRANSFEACLTQFRDDARKKVDDAMDEGGDAHENENEEDSKDHKSHKLSASKAAAAKKMNRLLLTFADALIPTWNELKTNCEVLVVPSVLQLPVQLKVEHWYGREID